MNFPKMYKYRTIDFKLHALDNEWLEDLQIGVNIAKFSS